MIYDCRTCEGFDILGKPPMEVLNASTMQPLPEEKIVRVDTILKKYVYLKHGRDGRLIVEGDRIATAVGHCDDGILIRKARCQQQP